MEQLKKQLNKLWMGSIFTTFLFLVVGILLILKPEEIITMISIIIGIGILVVGIFSFVKYFKRDQIQSSFSFDFIYGTICSISGSLLILNPKAVASILPLILGVWMFFNSLIKIEYVLNLKKQSTTAWISSFVLTFMTLVCGILFIFNPFKGAAIITQILGATLVFYAVIDIINSFLLKKKVDIIYNETKIHSGKVIEAVIEDED